MAIDSVDLARLFEARISESIAAKRKLQSDLEACVRVAERLIEAYQGGGKVLLFGNGGSAADAQHIAAEFVGRFYRERRALPAVALTVNTSALTAIGNDYSFAAVFGRQVEAFGSPGDVAIGISTSGNANNVIEGVRAARRVGLVTVGLTGRGGGLLAEEVDYSVQVPSSDTARIQEVHILIGHVWSEAVEQALFADARE